MREDSNTLYPPHVSMTHCWVLAACIQHSRVHPTGIPHSRVPLNPNKTLFTDTSAWSRGILFTWVVKLG